MMPVTDGEGMSQPQGVGSRDLVVEKVSRESQTWRLELRHVRDVDDLITQGVGKVPVRRQMCCLPIHNVAALVGFVLQL